MREVPLVLIGKVCTEHYQRHRAAYKAAEALLGTLPRWKFAARQRARFDFEYHLHRASDLSGVILEADLLSEAMAKQQSE